MTWIIGSPTMFGYAMGVSDIQVTWGEAGPRHDCLQKVYHVAPFIAYGFAGSVRLGFRLLEDLQGFLSPLPGPGESWMPRWVAHNWYRRARWVFSNEPEIEQKLGLSIILMGVRPQDNSGCITGGHPDVIVLSAKNGFKPDYTDIGNVASIGSGNNVEVYAEELRALQRNAAVHMQGEIGQPGGMGRCFTNSLARFLLANPATGISQNVHHITVWRDRVCMEPLDLTKFSANGKETQYKMPPFATGWEQFSKFAKGLGLSAAEARA